MNNKIGEINLEYDSKGLLGNKYREVKDFLHTNYNIRINKFKLSEKEINCKTKKYDFPPGIDDISLHLFENEIQISDGMLRKIMNSPNQIKPFNPIQEYFDSIEKEYKGSSHIDKLCTLMTATDYGDKKEGYYQVRMINLTKKWLVACVACGLEVWRNDVCFGYIQEEQGIGKTSICELLVPKPLNRMFTKSNKEKNGFNMQSAFTENFLILFDEMNGVNNYSAENFKSTLSAEYMDIKDKFDPFPKRKNRIGNGMFTHNNITGNNKGFLYPSLGTRRFGCIHLENIELEQIYKEVETDQIWAEAYTLFKGGFDYKFKPVDFAEFIEYNQRFMIETNALKVIENNFTIPENGQGDHLTPTMVLIELKAKKVAGASELSPEKIGAAFKQLGYSKSSKRIGGSPSKPYYVKRMYT